MNDNPVIVGIAQGNVVQKPRKLISYALGSCVGVCLYDRERGIAGMVHILLPSHLDATDKTNPYKFADTGCDRLFHEMLRAGGARRSITAKIAGGAEMFHTGGKTWGIGKRNVKAVREALAALGIRLIAEDTGEDYGRTVMLDSATGIVTVKSVKHGLKVI